MNKKIKAIVFDWDGTLFNSMSYKRENFYFLFKNLASKNKLLTLHKKYSGIPRRELFSTIYYILNKKKLSSIKYQKLSKEYTQLNLNKAKKKLIFKDVAKYLPKLKKEYLLFVSSSSANEELKKVTKKVKISHYFNEVMGSSIRFNKGKEHFSFILKKYHLKRGELYFVGDDTMDTRLAKKNRIKFFRIRNQKKYQNLSDLNKKLRKIDP